MNRVYPSLRAQPDFDVALIIQFTHHSTYFDEAEEWCKKNCKGKWFMGMPNPFFFKFETIADGMAFDTWQKTTDFD